MTDKPQTFTDGAVKLLLSILITVLAALVVTGVGGGVTLFGAVKKQEGTQEAILARIDGLQTTVEDKFSSHAGRVDAVESTLGQRIDVNREDIGTIRARLREVERNLPRTSN